MAIDWNNTPESARHRRHVNLTLPPAIVEKLDRLARAWRMSRSRAVERLVDPAGYAAPKKNDPAT